MMKDKMRHHVWADGKVKCRQGWEKKKNHKRMMGRNESRKQKSKEKERREKQIIKA